MTPRLPLPLLLLAAGALIRLLPGADPLDQELLQDLVSAALVLILFEGGLQIGVRRIRAAARPVLALGLLGTVGTVVAAALVVHLVLGLSWYVCALIATAIAPTDPAVVFSVLGGYQIEGRSGTVLEGESGANDPVGISLMAALLAAGSLSGGAVADVATRFALQLVVGAAVGVIGGRLLLVLMHRLPLPLRVLHPLRVLVCAIAVFALAALAHGSGFLAVFIAGIVLADEDPPHKREILRVYALLASAAEVLAFGLLGFSIELGVLAREDVWVPGLLIAAALIGLVRPLVGAPLLLGSGLPRGERGFVLLTGLKGAVPLLLGTMLLTLPNGSRLYGVVVVVVVVSVLLQGGLVAPLARLLKVPMREI